MPIMSPYKRAYRTAKKTIKKRYYNKSKGTFRLNRLYKDVYNLKQAINSEKKHHIKIPDQVNFAQYTNFGSASGHQLIEITPIIPVGTQSNERVGNQVKLTGACIEFLMTKANALHGTIAYKIYIIRQPNGNDPMSVEDFLQPNHFIGGVSVYDTSSQRNQQQMPNFKVVKVLSGRIQQDQNDDPGNLETRILRNFTIPLKFTKDNMLRYNAAGSTTSIHNRFYVLCTASNGDTGTNTHITLAQYVKWYYVDN